jgi:ABC-2 type transport system permease protein
MKMWSVAWKDIQILLKDRGTLIVSFLLPLLFILAWSLPRLAGVSEGDERVALPVVNLDGSQASQEFVGALNAAGGIEVVPYEEGEAQAVLAEGDIQWLLEIPADFAAMSLEHPVTLRLIVHPDANEVTVESVTRVVSGVAKDLALQNQLLASFQQLGEMMAAVPEEYQALNTEVYVAQAQSQFERSKVNPLVAVEQTVPERQDRLVEFTTSNVTVPGFTILFVFLTAQVTAQSVFQEKKQGTFRRLLAAPLSKPALLAGKMLPNLITNLLQIVVVFAVAALVFPLLGLDRLSLGSNPLAVALVSLLVALCSTGLGVLLAALAHTEAQVGALSAVVLWVLAALGGSFVPTFLLSGPLKTLSAVTPHSWALRAYNDLFVYGRGLADILPELAVLAGFTAFFFAIGLWRFDFD